MSSCSRVVEVSEMLMTDQVAETVFGAHLGSGATLGCLTMCVEWFALPASCMSCGALGVSLPLFRFLPSFPQINRAVRVS
jgi:hypothetical protein